MKGFSVSVLAAGLSVLGGTAGPAGVMAGELEESSPLRPTLDDAHTQPGPAINHALRSIPPEAISRFGHRRALSGELNTYVCAEGTKDIGMLPYALAMIYPEQPDLSVSRIHVESLLPLSEQHPDHAAMLLADFMLGQATTSRLWTRLREREGLAYTVESSIRWNVQDGRSLWALDIELPEKHKERAAVVLLDEIRRVRDAGFTEDELREAKTGLAKYRLLWRGLRSRADAESRIPGLPLPPPPDSPRAGGQERRVDVDLERVSLEQMNAALRRYIDPSRFSAKFVRGVPKE